MVIVSISRELDEADEYCPHCDNHFVIPAIEPTPYIGVEGEDPRLVRDHRLKQPSQSVLNDNSVTLDI